MENLTGSSAHTACSGVPRTRMGLLQRAILTALTERRDTDRYEVAGISELFDSNAPPVRARWRWYTIDLLDLVDDCASDVARASLNQAVRALVRRGVLQSTGPAYPYGAPFAGYRDDEFGATVGAIDLAELHAVDARWPPPGGRRLWFRLPPPAPRHIPPDDQICVLAWLYAERPDSFDEFAGTVNRHRAWSSDVGRFLRWLLCGQAGPDPPTPALSFKYRN